MADGSTEVDRLTVVWDADIAKLNDKLDKVVRAHYDTAGKVTKKLDEVDDRWGKLFGKSDPGKAVDRIFESSRLKLLDTGVARIGLVGGALEELGPAGLLGAAGVGALIAAFVGAKEATVFAAHIEDIANKAHVTTDFLQELRFAIRDVGGEEAGADEALHAFGVKLGEAEAGVVKAQRPFKELFGTTFGTQSIRNLGGVQKAIEAITRAIEGLPTQQKDAVLEQFGLTGLAPLLEQGLGKLEQLKAQAKSLGLVMDTELVKRGADLDKQFDTTSKVIETQLKSALVDLGPVLLDLLKFMAQFAKLAADAADEFKKIEDKRTATLQHQQDEALRASANPLQRLLHGDTRDLDRAVRISAELGRRDDANKAPTTPATHNLSDISKTAADDTKQRTDSVNAALATAEKTRLEAEKGLTENIEARARIEGEIADQEAAAEIARLDKLNAEVQADKGISAATKKKLAGLILAAEAADEEAAQAKQELIQRNALRATLDDWFDTQKQIDASFSQIAGIAADEASTAKDRLAIQLKDLDTRQKLERQIEKELLDRQVADGVKGQSAADAILKSSDDARAAQRSHTIFQGADPLDQFTRSVQDLDTIIKDDAVSAFKNLSDSIGQSAAQALGLKGILGNLFAQIVSAEIQKNGAGVFSSILHLIPGFASGTAFAPGGLAVVGENGPELVSLPRGAQVIPNGDVRAMTNASISPSAGGSGGVNLFDLRGAVVTADILDQMNRIAARNSVLAVQASRAVVSADLQRKARRRFGS